jgi:hypothetical protein
MTATLSPETKAIIGKIAGEYAELHDAAERILFELVPTLPDDVNLSEYAIRGNFDAEQLAVFDLLGWDKRRLRKETARINTILRNQAVAGTGEQRAAAEQAAADAAAELDKRDDELLAKIAQLQKQLAGLQAEAKRTADLVIAQNLAVESLRGSAREDDHKEYHRLRGEIINEYRKRKAEAASDFELADLETERQLELEAIKPRLDRYVR